MINPCLPHAERVRLGLTPADPNYMPKRTPVYNPDAKINAEQRAKNAKAAGQREGQHADAVRTFSPWELDELRMDMLSLPTLRAERFVTLIDAHQAADAFREAVNGALDEANTEELNQRVEQATDEIGAELSREVADAIVELDLSGDAQANAAAVLDWYEERIKAIRKEVTDQLDRIHAWSVDAEAAIAPLNIT